MMMEMLLDTLTVNVLPYQLFDEVNVGAADDDEERERREETIDKYLATNRFVVGGYQ